MFQNISKDSDENLYEDVELNNKKDFKEIIKKLFDKKNIILYLITFIISMVGFSSENVLFSFVPFGLAIIAAAFSNGQPIGIMYVLSIIGTFLKFGLNNTLTYIITSLLFFVVVLFVRPHIQEGVNEQRKIGIHLFFSVFIVQVVPIFFGTFYVYDFLASMMLGMATYIFYKIFVSSIGMIQNLGHKKAFTIEEVMGTSLLLAITVSALGDFSIFGFSLRNILSILIVLALGWKNGILVGATSGITIGIVLGIICGSEPIMIAAYAVSGMIAGIMNRFGRIGVIVGFLLGNVIIAYVSNGNTVELITFQEILIASLGLLAIPKSVEIKIEDLFGTTKLLPETTGKGIEGNKDTIF